MPDSFVRRFWPYLLTVVLLAAVLTGVFAALHRAPWTDEGWFSSAAYNLAHHGFLGTTIIEPAGSGLTRIDQRTYWVMPLFLVLQGLWLKVAPASLFTVRLFTLLWYPLALWSFYRFLLVLLPHRATAILAAGLLGSSYVFIDNAAFGRPDVPCLALGLAALAAYVSLRKQSLEKALFVSNACIAAAGMMHPNAVYHALGLAVLMLWMDARRLFRPLPLLAAAAPYLITAALWGLYIAQDVQAFRDQMGTNGSHSRWPANWNPLHILWSEIHDRYLVAYGFVTRGASLLKAGALLAYLAAIADIAARRDLRSRADVRLLFVLLGVYFVALSIFNQKLSYYLVHIVWLFVALLAIVVTELWNRLPRARLLVAAALLALTAVEIGGLALRSRLRSYRADHAAMTSFVRANSAPGERINGSAALLFGFDFDPHLKDDPMLGTAGAPPASVIVIDYFYREMYAAWETERPETMRRLHARLDACQRIYQHAEFEVFRCR